MELPLSIILIIRVIQLLLAIILIGLTACIVHKLYLNTTNFLLFASIWTVFPALTYEALELRYPQYQRVLNPSNSKGFNFVTAVFWFGGFIALAVFYRDLDYCFGKVCGVMVATIILAAFEWVLWTLTTLFSIPYYRSITTPAPMESSVPKDPSAPAV